MAYQLVVGPLEKPLVKQPSERPQLPHDHPGPELTADAGRGAPAQLFQFGLAAEDEAREVAPSPGPMHARRAVAPVAAGR